MIDALCGVTPEEDFVLPDGDVETWSVNQVAGWAATKLSARTARALRANEVDGALLVGLRVPVAVGYSDEQRVAHLELRVELRLVPHHHDARRRQLADARTCDYRRWSQDNEYDNSFALRSRSS